MVPFVKHLAHTRQARESSSECLDEDAWSPVTILDHVAISAALFYEPLLFFKRAKDLFNPLHMERLLHNYAHTISSLRDSITQGSMLRSAYAQMDQESENGDDDNMAHSLFFSLQQDEDGENIPLTESHDYSDRSQLIFAQEEEGEFDQSNSWSQHYSDRDATLKPSAIYVDVPTEVTSSLPTQKPLSESLLPTSAAIPPGITTVTKDRKYKDPFFAGLYLFAFGVFLFSGFISLVSTNSHAIERYARGSTFSAIKDSAGLLTVMLVVSLVSGAIWLIVLRTFTRVMVWGTVISVPITMFSAFVWSLTESLHWHTFSGLPNDGSRDTSLILVSLIPLLTGLVYVKLIFSERKRINRTIEVIELACDVLRSNLGVLVVTFLLMVVFIVFTVIWMVFFTRLWLMGRVDQSASTSGVWVVNQNVYWFAAFFIFFYMWTAALLINMQRFCLSAITAQWYFHRNEPTKSHSDKAWKRALICSSTTSLGTLALGGLILSIVQFLQFFARQLKKSMGPLTTVILVVVSYIESLVSQVNHFVISLAGITNENFCSSAKSATKIFRRNLLSGLLGDLLTKLVLYVGALVLSLLSGIGAYTFATHALQSPHGLIVGVLAALVPLYLSQFFSFTLMSIVDATFLCYAIDLDTGTVHFSAAHDIFSGFQ